MAFATEKWWNQDKVAVVTGANKGIGFEIARLLTEQGLTTVMTARNEELGLAAKEKIANAAGNAKVLFHQLDITDPASVQRFAAWAKQELGSITILVNNAGFAYKGNIFGADEAEATLATNYFGVKSITEALLPLMPEDGTGRIVNVSSRAGLSSIVRDAGLRNQFLGATSAEQITDLVNKFVASIRAGKHSAEGWPNSMYGISKLAVSMYTRILAKELESRNIMVNACCPGYCQTDMSSGRGNKTAAEGADTPVWLALTPPKEFKTGGLYGERTGLSW